MVGRWRAHGHQGLLRRGAGLLLPPPRPGVARKGRMQDPLSTAGPRDSACESPLLRRALVPVPLLLAGCLIAGGSGAAGGPDVLP